MKCTRCCGLRVADDLLDLQESYLPMWMRARYDESITIARFDRLDQRRSSEHQKPLGYSHGRLRRRRAYKKRLRLTVTTARHSRLVSSLRSIAR